MTIDFPPLVQKKIGGMAKLHKGLQKNNQRQEHELKKYWIKKNYNKTKDKGK